MPPVGVLAGLGCDAGFTKGAKGPKGLLVTRHVVVWGADQVGERKEGVDKETLTLIVGIVTGLISLVAAVGVLLVNAKVDHLTGRVDALQAVITSFVTR